MHVCSNSCLWIKTNKKTPSPSPPDSSVLTEADWIGDI